MTFYVPASQRLCSELVKIADWCGGEGGGGVYANVEVPFGE